MNEYEIAVLYHPDLEIDLGKAEDKVKKIIADNGGTVTGTDNWGKRKTAYPINGHEHAVYVFYAVEMPGSGVAKTESTLNITDEVIRFLITKPDRKAIDKAAAHKAKRKGAPEQESKEETESQES